MGLLYGHAGRLRSPKRRLPTRAELLGVVTIPCCNWFEQQARCAGRPPSAEYRSGPPMGGLAPLPFLTVNRVCTGPFYMGAQGA
jgi:hypothetical protein